MSAISTGIKRPDAPADLERPNEGLLQRHLLVKDKANQQRKRIGRQKSVGFVVARPGSRSGAVATCMGPM